MGKKINAYVDYNIFIINYKVLSPVDRQAIGTLPSVVLCIYVIHLYAEV